MIQQAIKRGSAELAILAVLARQPAHGYEIARHIEAQSRGLLRFELASLYPMLYRMEKRGWIKARWQTAPSGRQRRYYRLTPLGRTKLPELRKEWGNFFRALHNLAGVSRA